MLQDGEEAWNIISDEYIKFINDANGWRKFFSKCGVIDFVKLDKQSIEVSKLSDSRWKDCNLSQYP